MAYLDVGSWSAEHVASWLFALHPRLEKSPFEPLLENKITGTKLMLMSPTDLRNLVPDIPEEALERILTGVKILRQLDNNNCPETLQSLTLKLSCQAKYLHNQLLEAETSPKTLPVSELPLTPMTGKGKTNRFNFAEIDSNIQLNQTTKQRVSLETLDNVSKTVDYIIQVVNWLSSHQFATDEPKFNIDFRNILLRVAVELTSTAQRDQFVEQPNDLIKKTSRFLSEYCEWIVLAINDPDFIQPCRMDVVSVKKKPEEEDFGIVIKSQAFDILVIEDVIFSSPAHRTGRISIGDEIIQIDYQTVVCWPVPKIMELMKNYTSELILTILRRPTQPTSFNPSINVIKPYAIPNRRIIAPTSATNLVSQVSETNSSLQAADIESIVDGSETSVGNEPKEPKGPVYRQNSSRRGRELKRRMSISGGIADSLVDLSLADAIPIPTSDENASSGSGQGGQQATVSKSNKDHLTKSVSHDTAKLYLHTLSIERKHLWSSQTSKSNAK